MTQQSMIRDIVGTARRALLAVIAAAAMMLVILSIERSFADGYIAAANEKMREAAVVSEQIKLKDEQLTMSAWMAAATGDQRWADRYEEFLPAIGRDIARAKALAPGSVSRQFDEQTRKANDALVELEAAAFKAIRQGNLARAKAILDSSDYHSHKLVLAQGTDNLVLGLSGAAAAELEGATVRARALLLFVSIASGICFFFLWSQVNGKLSKMEVGYGHAERRLQMRAMHDELTGLPNRRSFNERTEAMVRQTVSTGVGLTAIVMLDLDNFKDVNDTLGHHVGV